MREGWRASKVGKALEIPIAQEREKIVPDSWIRCCLTFKDGFIDQQPRRSKLDHVVAICQSITIVAISSTKEWLIHTNAIIVRFVSTDSATGGEQAIRIACWDESQRCLLK